MIFLVSMFDRSYAHREMDYAVDFLNAKCKRKVAVHITNPTELTSSSAWYELYRAEDSYWVIADYKSHPFYWESVKTVADAYESWDRAIKDIPLDKIVIWLGDVRFKVNWPGVTKAISCYMSTFTDISRKNVNDIYDAFEQPIDLIGWKDLLLELAYNYSLCEVQTCWDNFIPAMNKNIDLTYIMHGSVKYCEEQVKLLKYLDCSMMLGDWPNRHEPFVEDFVRFKALHNMDGNIQYVDKKVFGTGWLNLISRGKYTLIIDNDGKDYPAFLSSRFWEAVRADVIPLIDIRKDPDKLIYKGFPHLETYGYFKGLNDLQQIMYLKPCYRECLFELKRFEKKYIGV